MKAVRVTLTDRRQAQRGSVLSAVLILTAFLAILSAALVTELSSNLLVSRVLVHQVSNQATVSSAVEMTIDQLQSTPVGQPCPAPSSPSLNSLTAAAAYASCQMNPDPSSPSQVAGTGGAAFTVDGTHVVIGPGWNVNEYLVGDGSSLYEVPFGSSATNWTYDVGAALTGPPNAVIDTTGAPHLLDLVPTTANCGSSPACVQMLTESAGSPPSYQCSMSADDDVTARPQAGLRNPKEGYFGDASGKLYAYDMGFTGDADCQLSASTVVADGLPIVAGPFVFAGPSGTDEVYVVASDGSQTEIAAYTFHNGALSSTGTTNLPYGDVSGAARDSSALPARLAITYGGGQVSLAQISATFSVSLAGSTTLPSGIESAPSWCQCPGGSLIGVGGQNGTLYVLNPSLALNGSFASGSSISTSPSSDAEGDWFFGASDSRLYYVSPAMVLGGRYRLDGPIGSSAIAGLCPNGLCVYVGTAGRHAYLLLFDTRSVVITACISTSPPTCSGDNPRLWVSARIGAPGAPRTVQILGWSYYSP